MKLEHLALSITDQKEIENFYQDIMGMQVLRKFQLDLSLANGIFGIAENPEVYLLQKDQLLIEVFISPQPRDHGFDHVCISTKQREDMLEKAKLNSYKCYRQKREHSDLVFISDKSGNTFEVKEY